MNAHQAWQNLIGQLQMEMSKAAFDTWVRSAELVNYEENVFTIGLQNAYARDWLESRLSSTITRHLTGLMNEKIAVNFIVWHKDAIPQTNTSIETPLPSTNDNHSVNSAHCSFLNGRYLKNQPHCLPSYHGRFPIIHGCSLLSANKNDNPF